MAEREGDSEVGAGGMPEEDSEDLTDEEVASAVPVPNVEGVLKLMLAEKCTTCGWPMGPDAHLLRRRKPHLYWKLPLVCRAPEEHMRKLLVIRVDWLTDV